MADCGARGAGAEGTGDAVSDCCTGTLQDEINKGHAVLTDSGEWSRNEGTFDPKTVSYNDAIVVGWADTTDEGRKAHQAQLEELEREAEKYKRK